MSRLGTTVRWWWDTRNTSPTTGGAAVRRWGVSGCHVGARGIKLASALTLDATVYAAEDGEDEEATDGGGDPNDDGAVANDPGPYFVTDGGASAATI